jgi:hypothetical protein
MSILLFSLLAGCAIGGCVCPFLKGCGMLPFQQAASQVVDKESRLAINGSQRPRSCVVLVRAARRCSFSSGVLPDWLE